MVLVNLPKVSVCLRGPCLLRSCHVLSAVLPGVWNPHGNQQLTSICEAHWLMAECSHFGLGLGLRFHWPIRKKVSKSNADLLPT